MDYKAMISARRREAAYLRESRGQHTLATEFEEDATAIETLLSERDAAVEDLRGNCWCCANGKPWEKAGPLSKMTCCEHLKEWGAVATSGKACKCQHWQWRGPQKHD